MQTDFNPKSLQQWPSWHALEHGTGQGCANAIHSVAHGEYNRTAVFGNAGEKQCISIWIPRYLCKASGQTVSLKYRDILKPNSRYSLQFIGMILFRYEKRGKYKVSVDALCDQWKISKTTLYRWKKQYPSGKVLLSRFWRAFLTLLRSVSGRSGSQFVGRQRVVHVKQGMELTSFSGKRMFISDPDKRTEIPEKEHRYPLMSSRMPEKQDGREEKETDRQ